MESVQIMVAAKSAILMVARKVTLKPHSLYFKYLSYLVFLAAQSPTDFCVRHGGGKKCQSQDCSKVSRGKSGYCASHGHKHQQLLLLQSSVPDSPTYTTSSEKTIEPEKFTFTKVIESQMQQPQSILIPMLQSAEFCTSSYPFAKFSTNSNSSNNNMMLSLNNYTSK